MSKHILLIEDDSMLSEMYSMALVDSGLKVSLLKDGRLAKNANLVDVDLVLLDVRLPEVDGLEILQFYRQHGYSKPVIIITNSPQVSQIQAKSLGATEFLIKSHTDVSDVLTTIQKYL